MSKKNVIRLFMFQTLFGWATRNSSITNLILAFKNGIIQLGTLISQITGIDGEQSQSIFGSGNAKDLQRSLLDEITSNIIKAARGWALSVNNLEIAGQLNFSPSRIQKISDKSIAQRATYWHGIVSSVISNLAAWDVTPEIMQLWSATISGYEAVYTLPADKKKARKLKTAQVNALTKQGMDFCRNILDNAVIGYKSNGNREFYDQYLIYRKLTIVASKHGKFRILAIDELGQPINNVEVKQDGTTNKITTNLDGLATLDIVYNKGGDPNQRNNYSFTLTAGSSTTRTGIIMIKHNETVSHTFVIAPTGFIIPTPQNTNTSVPA
ncbi:MAG: hypothetical protein ABIT08_17940 [Bacteroidia bacterium]